MPKKPLDHLSTLLLQEGNWVVQEAVSSNKCDAINELRLQLDGGGDVSWWRIQIETRCRDGGHSAPRPRRRVWASVVGNTVTLRRQRSPLLLPPGDVLQGDDPGQRHQTGARAGRQQV